MRIIPIYPDAVATQAAGATESGPTRRTFAKKTPTRRMFGRRVAPSRRTFGKRVP